MKIQYHPQTGKIIARKFAIDRLERAICGGDTGFCRACGAEQYGCEPDARRYRCEACNNREVYGAEELILMGAVMD